MALCGGQILNYCAPDVGWPCLQSGRALAGQPLTLSVGGIGSKGDRDFEADAGGRAGNHLNEEAEGLCMIEIIPAPPT